jgi:hypothetical protein
LQGRLQHFSEIHRYFFAVIHHGWLLFLFLREKVADLCELQIMKIKEVIAVLSAQKLSERDFPDAVWNYGGIIDVR